MYTSGWPKNQNRCWYRIGSPPPAGSKNEVLKFRSVKSMVMAPASTGKDKSSRIAVSNTDHTKRGISSMVMPSPFIFVIVVIKLADPKILDTPAKCREKIPRSTAPPGWPSVAKGGYTVHPVPTPLSTRPDSRSSDKAGGKSQNLMLFMRGNAISGAFTISGTNQLPNPPIMVGMTKKKIIIKACAVTITLYNWSSPNNLPAWPSSSRITADSAVPKKADQIPSTKYRVPMSLWLVEKNQRVIYFLQENRDSHCSSRIRSSLSRQESARDRRIRGGVFLSY